MWSEIADEGPKALLNSKERKMLALDETNVPDNIRHKRHSRIRKRLRWALYDFELLYDNWDEINLHKTFDDDELNYYVAFNSVSRGFSTLYRGLFDSQISFKNMLIDGVHRAEMDMNNRQVDVRFSVDPKVLGGAFVNDAVDRINPDNVDGLRIPEMRAILEALAYSDADLAELVREGRENWREAEMS